MTTELQRHDGRDGRANGAATPPVPHGVPLVDVYEDANGITLLADLPGVSRERLEVRVDGDTLLVEGTAEVKGPEGMELVYGEATPSRWRREFTLSRELDASRIDAQLKDGVLRLAVPRAEDAKPRRVEVRVG